jgi:hypothetical protein
VNDSYSIRRLSPKDHSDLWDMAQASMTFEDVVGYANRPRGEVIEYLRCVLPHAYERFLHNEQHHTA